MLKDSLPLKQKRFVEEYVIERNATAIYIRADYNSDGVAASVCASKLLNNAKVSLALLYNADCNHMAGSCAV